MSSKEESKDVEMAGVEQSKESGKKKKKEKRLKISPKTALLNDIRRNISTLERNPTARIVTLAVRNLHKTRSKLSSSILTQIVDQFLPDSDAKVRKEFLKSFLQRIPDDVEMASVDEFLEEEEEEEEKVEETKDDTKTKDVKKLTATERLKLKAAKEAADARAKKRAEAREKKEKANQELEKKGLLMTEAELKKLCEPKKSINHQIECFVHLCVLVFIADNNLDEELVQCAMNLIDVTRKLNIRMLDVISARGYFYWSLAFARTNRLAEIRPALMAAYRTCCLRHDEPGQAVLINLILQNYLKYNLVNQADKFRLHIDFPVSHGGSYQYARYLYHVGKINSVQLQYSEAFNNLTQAIRKAPQKIAVGFRQHATKLQVIVQLLMGEIPERSIFGQEDLRRSLHPYFKLTQAVRVGDVAMFNEVVAENGEIFKRDETYKLIVRLRHNVIKTGLRNISLSYSRISIEDISRKLGLDNAADAEYIIAKAIYDGVIDAVINKTEGYIFSKENVDIYSTNQPQAQFHKRITFCMDVHNTAVKALRYPDKPDENEDDKDEDILDQDAQDLELLSEISGDEEHDDVL